MWEGIFFKYTSNILALVGGVIGLFIYLIHDSLFVGNPSLSYCIVCLLIPASAGLICGRIIENLHHCAHRDQLTNLWNSRYFYSQLTKEIKKMKKNKSPLCMAFIDLDNFKMINDTYGHIIGDEVLKGIGTILVENTRDSDIVIRWGGDEFVIIFPDTDLDSATLLVERLRALIESSRDCRQLTISVGVLLIQTGQEVVQLLKMVDDTLYKAKKTKNSVVSFTY